MTVKIEAYRSTSGKMFDTEHESLRDDVRNMLMESDAINAASVGKLVDWLCEPASRLNDMRDVFKRLYDTHPNAPQPLGTYYGKPIAPGDTIRIRGKDYTIETPSDVKKAMDDACDRVANVNQMPTDIVLPIDRNDPDDFDVNQAGLDQALAERAERRETSWSNLPHTHFWDNVPNPNGGRMEICRICKTVK